MFARTNSSMSVQPNNDFFVCGKATIRNRPQENDLFTITSTKQVDGNTLRLSV